MRKIRLYLTISLVSLLALSLRAQQHKAGELLVWLQETSSSQAREKAATPGLPFLHKQLTPVERLSATMPVWVYRFDPRVVNEDALLMEIRSLPQVRAAQFNHYLYPRGQHRVITPNDPLYGNQWQYRNTGQNGGTPGADLNMASAWDVTRGGRTAMGDTVVLCVIDNGLDPTHADFEDNIWVNTREIPSNGLDDDNNGFVDDYKGWNSFKNNDDIDESNEHGTPVAGIMGAKGNNNRGVAGMNWNTKLMIVVGGLNASLESQYIKAMDYPLQQRKRYNASNGRQGAFVCAVNMSFGIDGAKAENYPLWCNFFDELGQAGILSIVATTNSNTDVDKDGDMPSTCASPYIIAVTNLNNQNTKVVDAGFGTTHVDMGTYGAETYTTLAGNSYGAFRGTSAATPHVTGAIGLMYSTACSGFAALAKSDPSGAATLVRQYVLQGARPNNSLAGKTVTGGRLDVNQSLSLLLNSCSTCYSVSGIGVSAGEASAVLSFNTNSSVTRVDVRYRTKGSTTWQERTNIASPFVIPTLLACQEYEYQVRTVCTGGQVGYQELFTFKTDGCCDRPKNLKLAFRTNSQLNFEWDKVTAATEYLVTLRSSEDPLLRMKTAPLNNTGFFGLRSCTPYTLQVQTICPQNDTSGMVELSNLLTTGCGSCLDNAGSYCNLSGGIDASEDWIDTCRINGITIGSASNNGYADFANTYGLQAKQNQQIVIQVVPGYKGNAFSRYTRIWIDYDQDAVFESSELVYQTPAPTNQTVSATIQIPTTAKLGLTRIRISAIDKTGVSPCSRNQPPPATPSFYGEVEDYCIRIDMPNSTREPLLPNTTLRVMPNPFGQHMEVEFELPKTGQVGIAVINAQGQRVYTAAAQTLPAGQHRLNLSLPTLPAGFYWLQLSTNGQGWMPVKLVKQ